ncbi:hypothetical protein HSX10_08090 [Winogradskyella undariae]|uniref:hypothetical protein n=1 Tax=Winogradskyella TaxID=286104 RepID=UPI00156AC35B|nr:MULTISPECIES: hypothetical protein [Winogradskyella]NRR91522.1 hypothetical protein [Winogradskyella undariae]QXP80640.1 hypothetical protein H0I32_08495 [Winogradskyella sp. HaHa_3_26]
MKKYALLILVFITTLTSCSIDDDNSDLFYVNFMPIESVDIPEYFVYGETYEIFMTYTKPNSCYFFRDFYYAIDGNERIVAIENNVYQEDNCDETPESETVSLNFYVTSNETYLFKFYQGKDEEGVDQFLLVEVPIIDERPEA